jgi:riboflavin biosynthesis pyrimidine reductase
VRLRTLLPEPGELETDELETVLGLGDRAAPDRPYLVANMVSSADGRATLSGRSGQMGGDADRELFQALRVSVDAVLAGTRTVQVERYGRLVRDPARRARRVEAGLASDPLAVLVTRRGDVPWEAPLFAAPEQRVAICTGAPLQVPEDVAAQVEVLEVPDGDGAAAAGLRALRESHGVRSVLCEGGPLLLRGLLASGMVDELFLTLAPVVTGPGERSLLEGPALPAAVDLRLLWLLESDGNLFARYAVREPDE